MRAAVSWCAARWWSTSSAATTPAAPRAAPRPAARPSTGSLQHIGPEAVERLDELGQRQRDRQRAGPVQPDVQGLCAAAAHVRGRAAADRRQAQPSRDARARPDHRAEVQELPPDRRPARLVVDEEALAPRRAAGRHGAVAAEVELVTARRSTWASSASRRRRAVGDQVVEALHHRRLVQRRQRDERRRPGRSRRAPRGSTASAAPRGAPARSTARAGAPRGARPASVHVRPARGRAAAPVRRPSVA